MHNGKMIESVQKNDLPQEHLLFAQWLLSRQDVIEVMSIQAALPIIQGDDTQWELDSGLWFLCRVDLPLGEGGITAFLDKSRGQQRT